MEAKPAKAKNSKCRICGHVTATVNAMRVHLNTTHGKTGRGLTKDYISQTAAAPTHRKGKSKKTKFQCTICGHTCRSDAGIIAHIQTKHDKSGSIREFYKKNEQPAKRKYTKREKPNTQNVIEMLGAAGVTKKDIKFRMTVDLEINLTKNSIDILPWSTNRPEGV